MSLTISNFKKHMIDKALKKGGVYENFGQTEILKLKDKYDYYHYGSKKERKIAEKIDALDEWAMSFDDNDLRKEFREIGQGMAKKMRHPSMRRLG